MPPLQLHHLGAQVGGPLSSQDDNVIWLNVLQMLNDEVGKKYLIVLGISSFIRIVTIRNLKSLMYAKLIIKAWSMLGNTSKPQPIEH